MAEQIKSFSQIVLRTMRAKNVTIRDIESATGYSYEQIRKVVNAGQPSASRKLSNAICRVLNLDADKMWSIAQGEKRQRKISRIPATYLPPPDPFFKKLWPGLAPSDVTRLKKIVEGMVEANRASGFAKKTG